jgi:hypothetical protein
MRESMKLQEGTDLQKVTCCNVGDTEALELLLALETKQRRLCCELTLSGNVNLVGFRSATSLQATGSA